jgi:hypothetical protein
MSNDEILAIRYAALFCVPPAIIVAVVIEVLKGRPVRWIAAVGSGHNSSARRRYISVVEIYVEFYPTGRTGGWDAAIYVTD